MLTRRLAVAALLLAAFAVGVGYVVRERGRGVVAATNSEPARVIEAPVTVAPVAPAAVAAGPSVGSGLGSAGSGVPSKAEVSALPVVGAALVPGPGPAAGARVVPVPPIGGSGLVGVPAPVAPSFDVVRVSPQGDAVIAGRAAPGAEVVVRDGGAEVARVTADRRGEFVAMPAVPLAAGGRELTLASREARGAEVKGEGSVVLVVPSAPATSAPASAVARPLTALLVPSEGPPRVLQEPVRRDERQGLSLDTVDYDDKGGIRFTGGASAGGAVRVYVDNAVVGDAASTGGRWTLTPGEGVSPGVHTLRVDRLDAGGRVLARVELPFQREALAVAEMGAGRVVVQPGQSLWRLARLAYGRGIEYRVIYLANQEQIRDPRLIYPGQTFSMPAH